MRKFLSSLLIIIFVAFFPSKSFSKNRMDDFNEATNNFYLTNPDKCSIAYQKVINFPNHSEDDLKAKSRKYLADLHVFSDKRTETTDYLSQFDDNTFYIYDKFSSNVFAHIPSDLNYVLMIEVKANRIRLTINIIDYDLINYGKRNVSDVYPFKDKFRTNVDVKNFVKKLLVSFIPKINNIENDIIKTFNTSDNLMNDDW